MAHPPYIEAPTVRIVEQPVSGGIDISSFEHLLQGVSVQTPRSRVKGILPRIGAGSDDHTIEQYNFGQAVDYTLFVPFSDEQEKINPQKFIEDPSQYEEGSVAEGFSYDGVIEPFVIRDDATFLTTESPIAHSVKGQLMIGNEDSWGNTDQIMQFISLKFASVVEPYEDSDDRFGVLLTASVKLPGFITDLRRTMDPFDESAIFSASLVPNGDTFDAGGNLSSINAALLAMTGTIDDDFRPVGHKSAAAGWTYDNNPAGTDSIAFGGLSRTS